MADLHAVLRQLESERVRAHSEFQRLDKAIAAIRSVVGSNGRVGKSAAPVVKRTLSAAARRKISLAQKARWAKHRKQQQAAKTKV